jgi:hypothetical protein
MIQDSGALSEAGQDVSKRLTVGLHAHTRVQDMWSTTSLHTVHVARSVVDTIVDAVCAGCTSTVRDIVGDKE